MANLYFKKGLLAVIVLEIITLLYLVHIYNEFVSNPKNYYMEVLITKYEETQ